MVKTDICGITGNIPLVLQSLLERHLAGTDYFFEKRTGDGEIIRQGQGDTGFKILENTIETIELCQLTRVFHRSLNVSYDYLKRQIKEYSENFSQAVLIIHEKEVIGGFTARFYEYDGRSKAYHNGREIKEVHECGRILVEKFGPAAVDYPYRNDKLGAIAGLLTYALRPTDVYFADTKREGVMRGMMQIARLMNYCFYPSAEIPDWNKNHLIQEYEEIDMSNLRVRNYYRSGDGDFDNGCSAQVCYIAKPGIRQFLEKA